MTEPIGTTTDDEQDSHGAKPKTSTKGSKHDRKNGRLAKMSGEERFITPEEIGHTVRYESHAVNPYTSEEVQAILDKNNPGGDPFTLDPDRLRTMHAGISELFASGKSIQDTADALEADKTLYKKLPPVQVVAIEMRNERWEDDGDPTEPKPKRELRLFAADHRRVVAARLAGHHQVLVQFESKPTIGSKFTTRDNGMSVEVRRYFDTDTGAHQRSNKPTLSSASRIVQWTDVVDEDGED